MIRLSPEEVARQRSWVRDREAVVELINEVRADLSVAFDTDVDSVSREAYRREVETVFAEGDRGVNVAALVAILRELDVEDDYPGFVVDELLGRELAGTIAGGQPLRLLAEATFHYADVRHHPDGDADRGGTRAAGTDDLEAALAAGFQTRLPGWDWRTGPSPFRTETTGE